MVIPELDVAKASLMEVEWATLRLMVARLETIRLGKKGRNLFKSKKTDSCFLTSGARMAFTKLRQAFIKALILHHFDLERHIRVETDISAYAIGGVLSQLTSDNSSQ